jgi:hypothetical protein
MSSHQPELPRQLLSMVSSLMGIRLLGAGQMLDLLSSVQIRGPINRASSLRPRTLHDQSAHIHPLQNSYPYHYFVHFLLLLQQR